MNSPQNPPFTWSAHSFLPLSDAVLESSLVSVCMRRNVKPATTKFHPAERQACRILICILLLVLHLIDFPEIKLTPKAKIFESTQDTKAATAAQLKMS